MKHLTKAALIVFAFVAPVILLTTPAQAHAQDGQFIITNARVARPETIFYGALFVTIGGQEKQIAERAIEAWIIQSGRKVVYSDIDGAGGFENEGQSLRVYDARTGKIKKVMSEYVVVEKVTEVTTSRGKTALLVDMTDGGLGGHYLAVVDPERGEVFYRHWAKLLSRRGDIIVIGHYKEDDWDKFMQNENARVRPYKTERQNLNAILRRRVIYNKPDRP